MKNILIIGQKSFIAKNFIEDYSQKFNLFYFKKDLKIEIKKIHKFLTSLLRKK